MSQRADKLLEAIKALGADAVLLHKPENISYFTGFTGEGYAYINKGSQSVVTDSRYSEQARNQSPEFTILERSFEQFLPTLADLSSSDTALAYEDDFLSVSDFHSIEKALPGKLFVSSQGIGAKLREIKDKTEIDNLHKAAEITDQVFSYALTVARPGINETDLVTELKYYMAKNFKANAAFDFIVAAGENGSMPHAIPGSRIMKAGDMGTLDFGAEYMGYKADMTRTFALGRPSDSLQEIYNIVHEAQQKASEALKPGVACKAVDAVARDLISAYGYGANFGHGLGHGVGLEIHEGPRLNRTSTAVLAQGMAVTVEPGIYLPGLGGVRIEDTCLITETGWVSLFKSDKNLIIL
jgi:Xaa-Pro aminopeptidase